MSTDEQEGTRAQHNRIIKPQQFDANTTRTAGMQRVAAVSKEITGSQGLWAGVSTVAPNVVSGILGSGLVSSLHLNSEAPEVPLLRLHRLLQMEQPCEPPGLSGTPALARHAEAASALASLQAAHAGPFSCRSSARRITVVSSRGPAARDRMGALQLKPFSLLSLWRPARPTRSAHALHT